MIKHCLSCSFRSLCSDDLDFDLCDLDESEMADFLDEIENWRD